MGFVDVQATNAALKVPITADSPPSTSSPSGRHRPVFRLREPTLDRWRTQQPGPCFAAGQSGLRCELLSDSAGTAQIVTWPNTLAIAENELNRGLVADNGGEREIGGIVGELVQPMELSTYDVVVDDRPDPAHDRLGDQFGRPLGVGYALDEHVRESLQQP